MSETFKWGIIGPGRIADKFATDLKVVDGAVLHAVASKSGSTKLADKFGVPVVYREYFQIVEDPDLDAIYIATTHNSHAEAARICLEAGKPVLVEKPLTVNAAETEHLISLAQEKQVFMMEAMWTRFLPVLHQIKRWIGEGLIGDLKAVQANMGFLLETSEDSRVLNPSLAGGCLLDIGIYPISVIQFLLQAEPEQIQAKAVLARTGVDVFTAGVLQYSSGVVAQFSATSTANIVDDLTILGSKGKITVEKNFYMAEKAELEVYGQRKKKFRSRLRSGGFEYQIEEAMACIRAGKIQSDVMPHAESLGNMRVMDEIREQIGVKYPFE